MEVPDLDRRVFRQVMVGAITRHGTRLTWVLTNNPARVALDLYCETAPNPGIELRLDGADQDESIWSAVAHVSWSGTAAATKDERVISLAAEPHPSSMKCLKPPERLTLTCRTEDVSVRPTGATVTPIRTGSNDSAQRGAWKPPTIESVRARVCALSAVSAPYVALDEWPVVFVAPSAKAPGIEWAYENSDMVLQEGSYRWLPASPL